MRALIIGTGYVGLPLARELVRGGHEVFGLRRSPAVGGELEMAGIKPLFADITKSEQLEKLPREFDWVVNSVASSGGGAQEYRQVYLRGMRNVIEWLAPAGRLNDGGPRLVYTSSTSVYAQTDGSAVDESSPTEPAAETARVLLETENALLAAAQQRDFPAIILRVAGIYGPGRGYWLKQFLNGEARIEGKGERTLNMIHRDDVVGCVIAALERGQPGNIYNAVDDEPVSQLDFFSWLSRTFQKPMPEPAPEAVPRKRGRTNKRVVNHKLKIELGYRFKYPTFRTGFSRVQEN